MIAVEVDELRRLVADALDHLAEERGPVVELDHDYFWSLPAGAMFDVSDPPASPSVGQVSESIDFLRNRQGGHLSYELVWIADVLRAVGAQVVR